MTDWKNIIDYQGDVYCPIVDEKVTVLIGHKDYDHGHDTSFVKVLCPYLVKTMWGGCNCEKGGKCGVYEGAKT